MLHHLARLRSPRRNNQHLSSKSRKVGQDSDMGSLTWDRVDASFWTLREVEQAGSTEVQWLVQPGTGHRWLHKDTKIPSNGIEQGEDWAEVVATHVAGVLQVPCAQTTLCFRNNRRGSLSRDVVPDGSSLSEGHTLLETTQSVLDYFPHSEERKGVDPARPDVVRPGHSLLNIKSALQGYDAPLNFTGPSAMSGFDVFAGYMLFDALIANRDRHEQNWAVTIPAMMTSRPRLAPSYDHAGGLGYNLTDQRRQQLLTRQHDFDRWAAKGTAHRFEHQKPDAPTLVRHASDALSLSSPKAQRWWRETLARDCLGPVLEALQDRDVSGMSALASTFAHDMLQLNLRRLRDELNSSA